MKKVLSLTGCLLVFLVIFMAGCADKDVGTTTLTSIEVTPAVSNIPTGTTQQYKALGVFSDGTSADITTSVTWQSGTTAVATINALGLATGIAAGQTVITATTSVDTGSKSATAVLTVSSATLNSVIVTPANPTIPVSVTQQFSALGVFSDGTSADITTSVTWQSGTTTVATIDARGLATGFTAGQTVITATSSIATGSKSATALLTVRNVTLNSVIVSPANPTIPAGVTQQFRATGVFSDGTSADLTNSVTWRSGTAAVASIDPVSGLATGLTAGQTEITAISSLATGSQLGSTLLTVKNATLSSITIAPASPSIAAGVTQQFRALGIFSDGTSVDLTNLVTWTSGIPAIATINSISGLATGVTAGSSVITATSSVATGSKTGTTTLTVTNVTLSTIAVTPSLPSISSGQTLQFMATGTFSDATTADLTNAVTWTSGTPGVATINGSGLATGVTAGSSVITATSSVATGSKSGNTTLTVTGSALSPGAIFLGSAGLFNVLAGSTVGNTDIVSNPTTIQGLVGVFPGSAVIGLPTAAVPASQIHAGDPVAAAAKVDLLNAYNDAVSRSTGAISLPGNMGGLTLAPGLYVNSTSSGISGTGANAILTLQGDANAVWIFKMGSTLTTGSGTSIVLAGGAQAKNIFWQVGSSATLGTNSIFKGTILAQQSITLTTGVNLQGRALTQTGAVTLDTNALTLP